MHRGPQEQLEELKSAGILTGLVERLCSLQWTTLSGRKGCSNLQTGAHGDRQSRVVMGRAASGLQINALQEAQEKFAFLLLCSRLSLDWTSRQVGSQNQTESDSVAGIHDQTPTSASLWQEWHAAQD